MTASKDPAATWRPRQAHRARHGLATHWLALATLGAAVAALGACGGGGGGGSASNRDAITAGLPHSGAGVLSVSPLDTGTLMAATPLGNLSPPGHTTPTDHVYLYFVDPWGGQQQTKDCSARPVYAAGGGVVTFILQTESAGDTKIMVQMTQTFMYYYDHVLVKPGIKVGSAVQAGDVIATTTGRCPSMDLGVIDLDVNLPGLVNPQRYGEHGAHAVSPYPYFSEPLRNLYYSRVRVLEGVPANKDGRIDWGVRGRLVGDWFHASLPAGSGSTSTAPDFWAKSLAFVYDWYAVAPRIVIGGTIAAPGVLVPAATAPDAAGVSTASGLVAYACTSLSGQLPGGWLLVQMLADDRIKVEYFAAASQAPPGFTAAAQEYVR
jgi:hypothetical protein